MNYKYVVVKKVLNFQAIIYRKILDSGKGIHHYIDVVIHLQEGQGQSLYQRKNV